MVLPTSTFPHRIWICWLLPHGPRLMLMFRHGLCRALTTLNPSISRGKCTSIASSLFIRPPSGQITGWPESVKEEAIMSSLSSDSGYSFKVQYSFREIINCGGFLTALFLLFCWLVMLLF